MKEERERHLRFFPSEIMQNEDPKQGFPFVTALCPNVAYKIICLHEITTLKYSPKSSRV